MTDVKLAYYKQKDWKRFISLIDDRESMHDSWEEWYNAFLKTKQGLINQGLRVFDIEVDLDKLTEYCKIHKIKNNGKARSQFVQSQ
ncbi:MAG: hypothetical protein K8R54_11135 [Bacteroidales bacterium]|nr:hypothetical protein [Bacteroidales bacterium]